MAVEFQPTTVDLILELYVKTLYGDTYCIVIHMLSGPQEFYDEEDYGSNLVEFFKEVPELLKIAEDQCSDIWIFSYLNLDKVKEAWSKIPKPGPLYSSLWFKGKLIEENN